MIRILRRGFKEGYINNDYKASYIRPDIVYTLNKSLIERKYGTLKDEVVDKVIQTLIELLQKLPEVPSVPKSFERPPKRKTF